MAKTEIIKTLLKATKEKTQGSDEDRQEFLQRVAEAASDEAKMNHETWEALPKAIQTWVNKAIKALNADEDIPDPDGAEKPPEEPDEKDDDTDESEEDEDESEEEDDEIDNDNEESEMETKTKPKKKKAAVAKKAPAKKAAKPAKPAKAAKSNGTTRGTGAQTVIKQIMLKDPNISTEDLIERLNKKNLKPTKVAVTSIRSGMRHTLKVMADAGVLHHSIKLSKEA